jgi:hypothetical protein
LKRIVLLEWQNLPVEEINKYTGRMGQCVEAVDAAKGGHTKF